MMTIKVAFTVQLSLMTVPVCKPKLRYMLLVPTKVNLDQLVDAWHLSFNSHISTFVCAR